MSGTRSARTRSWTRGATSAAVIAATLGGSTGSAEIVRGFKETWAGTSVQGWDESLADESNPGTGGHGGLGDGYLRINRTTVAQLGARSSTQEYFGDYRAARVTLIRLWVTDVSTEQPIEVHLSIGNATNLWQYNVGVLPSASTWTEYVVDLNATAQWTRIVGTGTLEQALTNADRILVRHDVAPFVINPDLIQGDFGIDDLEMTWDPVPVSKTTWGRIKALYR